MSLNLDSVQHSAAIRGGNNVLFSKFEYLAGWMPLYNQFQDLFTKKLNSSCPTAIAQLDLKIVKNRTVKLIFPYKII